MRTQGAFYADTAHGGGLLWYGASNVNWDNAGVAAGQLAYVRNGAGDYSLNNTAGVQTFHITAAMADLKRLTIYPDNLSGAAAGPSGQNLPWQESFGTAAGGPGYPAGAPGLPPFIGATELVVPTTLPAKGIRIWKFAVVYNIATAALTSHSVAIYRTTYSNNVANSIVTPAISTTALSTATQANPYVSVITITSPVFETPDLSDTLIEVVPVTAATSLYRFYGIGVYCDFNYN